MDPPGRASFLGSRVIGRRLLVIALAIAIAVFSFGYRYLSLELTDDDYLFFAIGRQIQHFGDWPVRDLAEEGDPLHNVISAEIERRYRLEDGQQEEGRTWKYTLHDLRPANLRAIVLDPQIEDTANIDRTATTNVNETWVQGMRRALRRPPAIALAPGVLTLNNAVAWLYYLFVALPYLALLSLGLTRFRGKPLPVAWHKILSVAIVAAVAAPLWLRGNLYRSSRLADLAVPAAVLGAFLLARAIQSRSRRLATVCVTVTGVVAYVVTASSIVAFAQVKRGVDDGLVIFDAEARQSISCRPSTAEEEELGIETVDEHAVVWRFAPGA